MTLSESMDHALLVLNVAERLPLFSANVLNNARNGASPDLLLRQLATLHHQLVDLAEMARQAKTLELAQSPELPALLRCQAV